MDVVLISRRWMEDLSKLQNDLHHLRAQPHTCFEAGEVLRRELVGSIESRVIWENGVFRYVCRGWTGEHLWLGDGGSRYCDP